MPLTNIDPNTSVRQIRRGLGKSARARKRESQKRRRRLERLARWVSSANVKVFFQSRGAKCQKAPSNVGHELEVYVPTAEHEQHVTGLEPSVWDFVFQKAELVHELGHVLYTDFEAMEEYMEKVNDMAAKELFRNLFNIVEDGAIERQLASDFNVGDDLEIKNANLMEEGEPGRDAGNGVREHYVHEAIEPILMDWAKYDTERADALLDPDDAEYVFHSEEDRQRVKELLPTLRDLIRDVVTEPSGAERVRITYEYFRDLEEEVEDAGEMNMGSDLLMNLMQNFPDDGNIYFVTPGEPPEDAEALEPDEDDVVIMLEPGELSGEEEGGEEGEGVEARVEQQYGEQVEADEEEDALADDAEEWQKACEETGNNLRVVDDEDRAVHMETWDRAMRYGKKYKKRLMRALQKERQSERQSNQRAGRPDVQALWKLGYGNGRVFESQSKPDEKDYKVALLLDRSGSMGGESHADWIIGEAEATTIGLAWALEELGADTCVVSVHQGRPTLEKPFGDSVEDYRHVLASNESYGGTPLTEALELIEARLRGTQGQSLAFAVTDGIPDSKHTYEEALDKCTFPVVGAYFQMNEPDVSDVRGLYHRITSADKEGLSHAVEGLIKRMVV